MGEQGRKNFDFLSDDDLNVFSLPSVKGRLIKSVNYWRAIGAPHFVLDIINDGNSHRNNASARKKPGLVTLF